MNSFGQKYNRLRELLDEIPDDTLRQNCQGAARDFLEHPAFYGMLARYEEQQRKKSTDRFDEVFAGMRK